MEIKFYELWYPWLAAETPFKSLGNKHNSSQTLTKHGINIKKNTSYQFNVARCPVAQILDSVVVLLISGKALESIWVLPACILESFLLELYLASTVVALSLFNGFLQSKFSIKPNLLYLLSQFLIFFKLEKTFCGEVSPSPISLL